LTIPYSLLSQEELETTITRIVAAVRHCLNEYNPAGEIFWEVLDVAVREHVGEAIMLANTRHLDQVLEQTQAHGRSNLEFAMLLAQRQGQHTLKKDQIENQKGGG